MSEWQWTKDGRVDGRYFLLDGDRREVGFVSFLNTPECPALLMDRLCATIAEHERRVEIERTRAETAQRALGALVADYLEACVAHRDHRTVATSQNLADLWAELVARCGGQEQAKTAVDLYDPECAQ